jgi:Flp pilus assembly protein TadD
LILSKSVVYIRMSMIGFLQPGLLLPCLLLGLTACNAVLPGSHAAALAQISPLTVKGETVDLTDVHHIAPTPDLLFLDDEMREFVETYTGDLNTDRQRLHNLHRSVKSAAALGMQYQPNAGGGAAEVFHRGTADCLAYAHLFVALAREAGLEASYQWLEVRPQWSRVGEHIAVRLHVNVNVDIRRTEHYMVDIDPLEAAVISRSRLLSDKDGAALYHNNLAMNALGENALKLAWAHEVRALQLSPAMPHLWVNLGAIYRLAGHNREAEAHYLYALTLDKTYRPAMNNLLVLYELEENEEKREFWGQRVAEYRSTNPYYHAWQGDKAGEESDWQQALMHYSEAVRLMPTDSRLLYSMGIIHYQLEDYDQASHYITQAIDAATLLRDKNTYQIQLDVVLQEQMASA